VARAASGVRIGCRPVTGAGDLASGHEPLVTVLLPVFNGEAYLAGAIDSVLRQSYKNLELVVIDDGSTDGTAGIISGYRDARLVARRHEANRGLVAALNHGLQLARGELVARLDADDVADPARLEKQVERFRADPELVALGTGISYIDAAGKAVKVPAGQVQGSRLLRWRMLRGTCVYHPTLMLHRTRAGADARYSADYPHAEDYELLLRLSRRHRVDNLADVLVAHRRHAGSISARYRDQQRASAARALVEHVRAQFGLAIDEGSAAALLDPRWLFTGRSDVSRDPVATLLALERAFLASEPGIDRASHDAVEQDVALFLWKCCALAVTEWRGGPRFGMRFALLAAAAGQLLRRPRAALAALRGR